MDQYTDYGSQQNDEDYRNQYGEATKDEFNQGISLIPTHLVNSFKAASRRFGNSSCGFGLGSIFLTGCSWAGGESS